MSFTRRQFLVTSARAAAGIILPSYYEKVLSFIENHGEPLLEAPPRIDEVLYADYQNSDYQLNLGEPVYELPEMSWREVMERYHCPDEWGELKEIYGYTDADLDEPAHMDSYMDAWCFADAPNVKAFHRLNGLDIGTNLEHGDLVGGLVYYDGPMPGWDYRAVHAECEVSLSLLQHRLNELKTGIRVIPV